MLSIFVPIRLTGSNAREHHFRRHKRVKAERHAVRWMLNPLPKPDMPCTVLLERVGPTSTGLDDDNITAACKGVRDEVAAWLGINDASPIVQWRYGQERAHQWGVRISFAARP